LKFDNMLRMAQPVATIDLSDTDALELFKIKTCSGYIYGVMLPKSAKFADVTAFSKRLQGFHLIAQRSILGILLEMLRLGQVYYSVRISKDTGDPIWFSVLSHVANETP